MKFDDMKNHLERIISEKDQVILDLREKLQKGIDSRDYSISQQIDLDEKYEKRVLLA